MTHPKDTVFRRLFATVPYKNLKLSLANMSFAKDFVTEEHGDLYPLLAKSEDACEAVKDNRYLLCGGHAERFFCRHFPYATYELTARITAGRAGFCFRLPSASAHITFGEGKLTYTEGGATRVLPLPEGVLKEATLYVSCRPRAFDIYFEQNGKPALFASLDAPTFAEAGRCELFSRGSASLLASGNVTVSALSSYLDSGVSVADLRPIRFEDGTPLTENGKLYLTASVRMEEEAYQGVFSWVPGTAELALTGALFYDSGDGIWANDVAASVLYHREEKKWLLWVCSFAHDHILGHAEFEGDPRFGVNVIDITLMPHAEEGTDSREFLGFFGDEDPDFFYDRAAGLWRMAICRLDSESRRYRYHFFTSDHPFDGYRCIGKGYEGEETGGSFVSLDGKLYFLCGNSFSAVSEYRIYDVDGMHTAKFDYPDGGFRGWGTLIPVKMGSRSRLFWVTFDRHGGSAYRWSYGSLYFFEGDL